MLVEWSSRTCRLEIRCQAVLVVIYQDTRLGIRKRRELRLRPCGPPRHARLPVRLPLPRTQAGAVPLTATVRATRTAAAT